MLGVLAALTGAAALVAPAPRLTGSHACPGAVGFSCSTLTVPLDRSGRRPGTLQLAVAASDNTNAPRGDLLLIAGGPGQPGLPLLPRIDRILGAERKAYRIVVYDQRGTGAAALDCPALQRAMGGADLFPPPAAAVRACSAQLGPDRAFYGTDDVVGDMDDLRRALGVRRWTLDGVSYGTFVGERYALAHPDRVTRLVLDSVVPQTVDATTALLDEARATARVLRDVCGRPCVDDLAAVVRAWPAGPPLLDALTLDSIVDPTFRAAFVVPGLLAAARKGDAAGLNRFLATVHGWEASPAGELSQGLHASALCADWRFPWGGSAAPVAGRAARLARVVARTPASRLAPFDRVTLSGNGFVRECLPWAPSAPTPPPRGTIRVRTLLLAGTHDLSTPLEWARREHARSPGSRLVVVPGAGHSLQSRAVSDAGRNAVARFLLG
jgi:pimeloyl-ACP methyl ester carboxylesterase